MNKEIEQERVELEIDYLDRRMFGRNSLLLLLGPTKHKTATQLANECQPIKQYPTIYVRIEVEREKGSHMLRYQVVYNLVEKHGILILMTVTMVEWCQGWRFKLWFGNLQSAISNMLLFVTSK